MEIIGLIGAVLGFLFWFIKRKASRADDPKVQLQKKLDENNKAIADGDVNALLEQRLQNTRPRDSSGQDSDAPGSK